MSEEIQNPMIDTDLVSRILKATEPRSTTWKVNLPGGVIAEFRFVGDRDDALVAGQAAVKFVQGIRARNLPPAFSHEDIITDESDLLTCGTLGHLSVTEGITAHSLMRIAKHRPLVFNLIKQAHSSETAFMFTGHMVDGFEEGKGEPPSEATHISVGSVSDGSENSPIE
jgi:hypothetical protein